MFYQNNKENKEKKMWSKVDGKEEGKEEKEKKDNSNSNPLKTLGNKDEEKTADTKERIVLKIKNFIKKHPIGILYALLTLAIIADVFIVISVIIAIVTGGATHEIDFEERKKYYGDSFAFDYTQINLLDENINVLIGSCTVMISDYIKGIVYDTIFMDLSRLTDEQLLNFWLFLGWKLVSKNGIRFYLTNSIDYDVDNVISSIDAMNHIKELFYQ